MTHKLAVLVAVLVCSTLSSAQQVELSAVKGGIALSVSAQKTYQVMTGEDREPVLTLQCIHKGKKSAHLLIFSPAGEMAEAGPFGTSNAPQNLAVTVDGKTQETIWALYGDGSSFAYLGKTEPERMQFIHSLLSSGMVSIEFKPFLTGVKTTSTFDLSKLRDEVNKHPECSSE